MGNELFSKPELSKRTKQNIHKAIEAIMSESKPTSKTIINILENVEQQSFEFIEIEKYILADNFDCSELYEKFGNIDRALITLILTFAIKSNIKFLVIEKEEQEIDITAKTILNIESEPEKYKIMYVTNQQCYEDYANIFKIENYNTSIFISLAEKMKEWFFSLDLYTSSMNKEYIGKGKYKPLKKEIMDLKNSLRGAYISPYWYINKKLPCILGNNISQKLLKAKNNIDNSLKNIRKVLTDDINYLFPYGLYEWYCNLPDNAKTRIYTDGEEKFFEICKTSSNGYDIDEIIEYVIGLKIEYWNDDTPKLFYDELKLLKSRIEKGCKKTFTNGFKISSFKEGKCVQNKLYFSSDAENETISLIKKDILSLLDDYGKSVKHYEKIGAILEIAFMDRGEVI